MFYSNQPIAEAYRRMLEASIHGVNGGERESPRRRKVSPKVGALINRRKKAADRLITPSMVAAGIRHSDSGGFEVAGGMYARLLDALPPAGCMSLDIWIRFTDDSHEAAVLEVLVQPFEGTAKRTTEALGKYIAEQSPWLHDDGMERAFGSTYAMKYRTADPQVLNALRKAQGLDAERTDLVQGELFSL